MSVNRWVMIGLIAGGYLLTSCKPESNGDEATAPKVKVKPIGGATTLADSAEDSDGGIDAGSGDREAMIARGAEAYKKAECSRCHGADATGSSKAPNLTDSEWLHCDGSIDGIERVLREGISEEKIKNPKHRFAMGSATEAIPDPDELHALAVYVHSLSQK